MIFDSLGASTQLDVKSTVSTLDSMPKELVFYCGKRTNRLKSTTYRLEMAVLTWRRKFCWQPMVTKRISKTNLKRQKEHFVSLVEMTNWWHRPCPTTFECSFGQSQEKANTNDQSRNHCSSSEDLKGKSTVSATAVKIVLWLHPMAMV